MTTARNTSIRESSGEWHLTEWLDGTHPEFDVYIEFLSDGKFNSYEKVETSVYVRRSGNFTINGTRLSGRYNSGKPWKTDYAFRAERRRKNDDDDQRHRHCRGEHLYEECDPRSDTKRARGTVLPPRRIPVIPAT